MTQPANLPQASVMRRRAMWSSYLGSAVEYYDFLLYGIDFVTLTRRTLPNAMQEYGWNDRAKFGVRMGRMVHSKHAHAPRTGRERLLSWHA